ncbi:MAG: response regulator transcription factor [Ruminococcaceae bacterium]|nr:response regulator transcription factor [Oscillospiraceae bacterium]
MAYRITICDDSQTDAGYVETLLLTWAQSRQAEVHIRRFSSAEQYLFSYAEDKCDDILLLDIEMGAMDGVTLARKLRQENETIQIVFVTGYSDYIAEGYDVAALHYLMKPVNAEKFHSVLDRAVEKLQKNERVMNLEIGGEMVRVPLYQIRYLDVRQNYVTIHGKQDFTIKRPLSEVEKELDQRFCRVGRALIVNLSCVQRVTKTEVYLSDGTALPLPRGAYETLNRAIIQHT